MVFSSHVLAAENCLSSLPIIQKSLKSLEQFKNDSWQKNLSDCVLMPDDSTKAIVALIEKEPEEDSYVYHLTLVIFDLPKKQISHDSFISYFDGPDIVGFQGVKIDTGRYFVTKNQRAFGIKTLHTRGRSIDYSSYETLFLFLPEPDGSIRNLTEKGITISTDSAQVIKGDLDCGFESWKTKAIVKISKNKTNDLFDLFVKEESQESEKIQPSCQEIKKQKEVKEYIFKYDGNKYIQSN